MELEQKVLQILEEKIKTNQLILPSMPDVFIQVKKIVEDPSANISNIAKIITRDPSITARILKVANNAIYRSDSEITSIQHAVSRMGLKLIRTLITSHAITQMFNQPTGVLKPFFEKLNHRSIEVSAHAYAIASRYTNINPDDALLAGIVHNIGYLPMAKIIETLPGIKDRSNLIIEVMGKIHARVGKIVLTSWGFPQNIIDASINYVDKYRAGTVNIDLTDIMIIAEFNTDRGTEHSCTLSNWSLYPAFHKIGIKTKDEINKLDEIEPDIIKARSMLGISSSIK